MIQSPGGGSACHGVSLFIWREYGLQHDCDARKKEIKNAKRTRAAVSTQRRAAVLGGRHILDGCGGDLTGCEMRKAGQKVAQKAALQVLLLSTHTSFLTLRCHACVSSKMCVCRTEAGVFAQAPWLAESYFVSVEKVWDGMSGLCLTEHVCACVGGECV